jgi:response regulator of citrate/malate metabolism
MYRVAEYRAARPDSSADDVAEHIGASVSTARKYLRQLKQIQGGEE